ncbi:MAG: two-component system sensor histidine kinase NtrB [Nitrospirota bacterium]
MEEKALILKVKALITIRALFVTLLLGSSFLFEIGYARFPYPHALFYLIITLYTLTIIYSLLTGKIKNLKGFLYIQLILDVFFEIALIYITGGVESWFSFTLILTVISSSIVLNRRAGYIIATLSSILYGTLINLQFYRQLPIEFDSSIEGKDFLYNIFAHIISIYLTSYLSGHLSYRLEKIVQKLQERDADLRDLEFFNKKVIESLPSGLFTTDTSGNVLIFNHAAERITGVKKDFIIGKRIDRALPFLRLPILDGRMEGIIKDDGVEKIIGLNISTLRDIGGKDTGLIGIFQDLTELKKLETDIKKKEKWAVVGELSASIAHEIRNPLASLKGSIEMLKEGTIPQNHRERLMEIALKEMGRLNRIITDFLTYSRPGQPEFKRFDLHSVLNETLELLKNVEQNKGNISIKKDFSGRLEVNADPQKIHQVFWNLGINAIEAMPEGGELVVSTKNREEAVEISFRDSGHGIHEKNIKEIFYPFFTTKEQGTGLGLAIAYRIIEEHKGKLTVNSRYGSGTTFEIMLPMTDGKQ